MMPVHVNYPGTTRPETGTYYLVAQNGLLMHVRNDWLDAVIPVKEFQALEPVTVSANLKLPPIDALVFAKAVAFFRKVYDLHRSEAAVMLHYSKDLGWQLSVPPQKVAWSYVKYDMTERLEGYRCIGTMHSHGYMEASHSHVDVADESLFDGVHITIGSIESFPKFSMSAEVVFRGERFPLDEANVGGVTALNKKTPEEKEAQVEMIERFKTVPWVQRWRREMFSLDPLTLGGWEVPAEWLVKIDARPYRQPSPYPRNPPVPFGGSGVKPVEEQPPEKDESLLGQLAKTGNDLRRFFRKNDTE